MSKQSKGIVFVILILIGLSFVIFGFVEQTTAQINIIPKPCTFEINTDGTNIFSWNCLTNALYLKSTNTSYIFQQTLNKMANSSNTKLFASSGLLFVNTGNYTFCCTVLLNGTFPTNLPRSITIEGASIGLALNAGSFGTTPNQGTNFYYTSLTGSLFKVFNAVAGGPAANQITFFTFKNFVVSGTKFTGGSTQNATTGFFFQGTVSDIRITDVFETSLGNGIVLNVSSSSSASTPFNFFLQNDEIESNFGCGVLINNAGVVIMTYDFFGSNNENLAIINNSRSVNIENSFFKTPKADNILVNNSARVQISGNLILTAGASAVTGKCEGRQSPSGASGISVRNSNNITISGNYIGNTLFPTGTGQKVGIYLNSSKDVSITGNTFGNNTVAAIQGLGIRDLASGNIGFNPQPVSSVTAGASVWTYQNLDGYQETMILNATNGISAETCNSIPTMIVQGTVCPLAIGQIMTVTWTVTAPKYEKIPQ